MRGRDFVNWDDSAESATFFRGVEKWRCNLSGLCTYRLVSSSLQETDHVGNSPIAQRGTWII